MSDPSRRGVLALLGFVPGFAAAAEPDGKVPPPVRRYADVGGGRCSDSAFEIVNLSGIDIVEVYLRASGQTGNWGNDRLGDTVLHQGGRLRLDPGPGVHDLLLLGADGRALAAMRQNACSLSAVRVEVDGRLSLR